MKVTAAGIVTHYEQMGQGPIVILLHGWGCDWSIWSPIITALSEQNQLIIPDLPSFGASEPAPATWGSLDFVGWLSEFIAQVVPARTHYTLVGHSFGGKIAALFASQLSRKQQLKSTFSDQVSAQDMNQLGLPPLSFYIKRLILIDSAGLPDKLSWQKSLQKKVLGQLPETWKKSVPAIWKKRFFNLSHSADDYAQALPHQKPILKNVVAEHIGAELHFISCPTMVCWGALDGDTPLHQGREFANLIPQAFLRVFPKSGHFPYIDETAAFLKAVQVTLSTP